MGKRIFYPSDYRYQWAKGLARLLEDSIEKNAEKLNDGSLEFEHFLISHILDYTYAHSN